MFYAKTKRQLTSIQEVIKNHSNGIYKRIDENRELMELIMHDHHPDFLERNWWVAAWLETQDRFLDALREASGLSVNKPFGPLAEYPRPRPSYERYWQSEIIAEEAPVFDALFSQQPLRNNRVISCPGQDNDGAGESSVHKDIDLRAKALTYQILVMIRSIAAFRFTNSGLSDRELLALRHFKWVT